MKLKDIIKESATDVVARFYKEATEDSERFYNLENVKYKTKNKKYYDKHFESWFAEEVTPVFLKPHDKPQPEYTVQPKEDKLQSPGYRGLHYALAAAGLPYNKDVQAYKVDPARVLSTQAMSGARNDNG